MTITTITDTFSASGEMSEHDLKHLRDIGVSTVINVRPDNEVPEQKTSEQWLKLCQNLSLQYFHIPVTSGQYTEIDIKQFKQAVDNADKKVHCFCRTGTRAVHLFALANKDTESSKQLQKLIVSKGYDLTAISDKLD